MYMILYWVHRSHVNTKGILQSEDEQSITEKATITFIQALQKLFYSALRQAYI